MQKVHITEFIDTTNYPQSLRQHDANRVLRCFNPEYAPETYQRAMNDFAVFWQQAYGPFDLTHETKLTEDMIDKIIHVKHYIYYSYMYDLKYTTS